MANFDNFINLLLRYVVKLLQCKRNVKPHYNKKPSYRYERPTVPPTSGRRVKVIPGSDYSSIHAMLMQLSNATINARVRPYEPLTCCGTVPSAHRAVNNRRTNG